MEYQGLVIPRKYEPLLVSLNVFQSPYCCGGWSFILRPLMTLWSHWVAFSWPSERKEEGKLQEMSLSWAPHYWKETERRPNTSPTSPGPPSMCPSFTSFSRASLLLEKRTCSLTATELAPGPPKSLCGEPDPHYPFVGHSPQ